MRKYVAIFRVQLLNSLAYPINFLGRSLMVVLFLWIFFQLWRTVYAANGQTVINGLSLHDTLWYLMLAETLELGRPRLERAVSAAVKDGAIAYLLNKPYDFLLYQLSIALGESIPQTGLNALIGGALVWVMVGAPPPVYGWPGTLLVFAGAWLLHFFVNAMIGLAAFVTEEVAPFTWIYQKLVFVLGGMLIPLDFYPAWLQGIVHKLPFAAMMYAPARLFVQPTWAHFWQAIGMQSLWLIIFGGVLWLAYRQGLQRLVINGG
ncbi:MAG: hypothetical protein Fur0018_16540 [Anaerolineales bacterium]